ncbi:MAG: DUF2270 domain-containing protein [Acidobacteriota bacterium]|nr:DUF2270 domain-containing protein [Acidobacteriota bacterium]
MVTDNVESPSRNTPTIDLNTPGQQQELFSASGFVTQMAHLYRGEVARSNTWRTRLDSTTNWAVVTTAAVLTFAFSSVSHHHVVILMSLLLVWLFLVIESRRSRYYELSALRLRLIETQLFARTLGASAEAHADWAMKLVASLRNPEFPISFLEAIGRRLRRNYIWIFTILVGSWIVKLMIYPGAESSWRSLLPYASIGFVPGTIVVLCVGSFYVAVCLLAVLTVGLRASPGEVFSDSELLEYPSDLIFKFTKAAKEVVHRHEQLAIIITSKPQAVSEQLLSVLKRGVTGFEGRGMYTGHTRHALFCAVEPSEISQMKAVVYSADEQAFVVVNSTERIWGAGFGDLGPRWKRSRRKKQGAPDEP